MKLSPISGFLGPCGSKSASVRVQADMVGQEIGQISSDISIRVDGSPDMVRIAVGGSVMKQSYQFVNEHGAEVNLVR